MRSGCLSCAVDGAKRRRQALCATAQSLSFAHIMARKVVQVMEKQIEQEVWRRVRGPGGPTAEEALLP